MPVEPLREVRVLNSIILAAEWRTDDREKELVAERPSKWIL